MPMVSGLLDPDYPARQVRQPKYLPDRADIVSVWVLDYGWEPVCLMLLDASAAIHSTIAAQSDVLQFPSAIDDPINATRLPVLVARLDLVGLPSMWVTSSMTVRDFLEDLIGIFHIAQKFGGLSGGSVLSEGGLQTIWSGLSTQKKAHIQSVIGSFKTLLDDSDFTNGMKMELVLHKLGRRYMQQRDKPYKILGVEYFPQRR